MTGNIKEMAGNLCVVPRKVKEGVDQVDNLMETGVDAVTRISREVPVTHGEIIEGEKQIVRNLKHKVRDAANRMRPCRL